MPKRHYDLELQGMFKNIPGIASITPVTEEKYPRRDGYHLHYKTLVRRSETAFEGAKLEIGAGDTVLDWGCSEGVSTVVLANQLKNSTVIGLDISETRIRIATRRTIRQALDGYVSVYSPTIGSLIHEYLDTYQCAPRGFVVADGYQSPFADGIFQAVYCNHNLYYVMEEMEPETLRARMHSIVRLIKPGGYLLISGWDDYDMPAAVIFQRHGGVMDPILCNIWPQPRGYEPKNPVALRGVPLVWCPRERLTPCT